MKIKYANFICSSPTVNLCPEPTKPEYAFIGRSNVGKSSLINFLCGHKKLAKVSGTPGKTQLLNHFEINNKWYIVDLPGYGYAKVSKTQRSKWEKMIRNYLVKRENLQCVFLLIDGRIPPQKIDLEFANWLGEMQIPFVFIFTKLDKRQRKKWKTNIQAFEKEMLKHWEEMPQQLFSSSSDETGKEEILEFIDQINQQYFAK